MMVGNSRPQTKQRRNASKSIPRRPNLNLERTKLSRYEHRLYINTGTRTSIWPTRTADASAMPQPSGLSSLAAKTKGQLSTVGTAFNSAYGKAKEAITSPFTANPTAAPASGATLAATPKTNSINPEVYVMTGQLNESTGDYKKALDSYSKALEIEPKNAAALVATARFV